MRLYLDIDSRNFLESPRFPRALSTLALKRRDTDSIELQYLRDTTVQELPAGTTIRLGLKPAADYTGEFLASGTFTKTGTGTSTKYLLDLNLNTASIDTAFSSTPTEPETLAAMLEIEWTTGGTISSSKTLPATIANDVIRGDEGEPADLPVFYTAETSDFLATQAQAESGADNAAWMSPLRTAQAIAALTPSGLQAAAPSLPVPRVYFAPLPGGVTGIDMLAEDGTSAGPLPLANAPFVTAADLPAPLLAAYPVFLELLIYKPRRRAWKAPSPYILDENGEQVWQHPWPVNHPTRAGEHRAQTGPAAFIPIAISRPNHLPITEPFQTLPAWQTLHGRIGPRDVSYIAVAGSDELVSAILPVPIRPASNKVITQSERDRPWSSRLAPLHIAFRYVLWNPVTTRLHSGPMTPRIAVRPTKSPFFKEIDGTPPMPQAVPNASWIDSPAYACHMSH
jgi:hypothetical protein